MSVRVNLLPEATKQRDRAGRQRAGVLSAFAILIVALGGVWWWATSEVADAEDRLAAEERVTADLRTEANELADFQELATRRDEAGTVLVSALADEVSLASVLQDLAAVMPSDTQLDDLTVTVEQPTEETIDEEYVGTFNLNGQTLTSHAPGVERLLLHLEKITSLRQPYLNSSTLDDPDVRIATFSLDGRLGAELQTRRYADGLPEALR